MTGHGKKKEKKEGAGERSGSVSVYGYGVWESGMLEIPKRSNHGSNANARAQRAVCERL